MIDTILITGCAYGLGHALALKLANEGFNIFAVGRSEDLLHGLAEQSSNITPIIADIISVKDRKKINESIYNHKSISIIHNAAIAEPCQFNLMSEAHLRKHVEVNYIAPMLI